MGLTKALSYPTPQVRALLKSAAEWKSDIRATASGDPRPAYQPKVQPAMAITLGSDGVNRMVREYLAGAPAKELAVKYGYGLTTVKGLLRRQGARKNS